MQFAKRSDRENSTAYRIRCTKSSSCFAAAFLLSSAPLSAISLLITSSSSAISLLFASSSSALSLLLVPLLPFFLLLPLFLPIAAHCPPKRQRCKKCLEDTSPGNCIPGLSRNCMLDSFCRTDRVGHVYSLSAEKKEYKQGCTLSTYTRSHQSLFPSTIQVLGKGAASRRQPRRTGYYQIYQSLG